MTGRNKEELNGVTLLGSQKNKYPSDYAPEMLETFPNKHPDNDYFVKFNCPEFTSLCPMTGQPDFATIYISYVPGERMVESKSLKLYLFSFRNHGDFHEDCVNIIMKDLIRLMDPKYIEVWGKFTPRGGISIDPYCNYGKPGTRWEEVAFEPSHPPRSVPGEGGQPMSEKAMVLCAAAAWTARPVLRLPSRSTAEENVCALSIYYGQKHVKEIEAAKAVLEYYGVEGTSLDLTPVFAYSDCSLLSHSTEEVPEESLRRAAEEQRGGKPVTTYVPFRNGLFLSAAASVALSKDCSVIYYGAHHDDAAGNAYPDCSEEFVNAMNHSIVARHGRRRCASKRRSCAGTRRRSLPKVCGCSVPYQLTWSCYEGGDKPCGKCGTCLDPHPRVRGERCDRPCNEVKQKTAVSSETAVFFCPS